MALVAIAGPLANFLMALGWVIFIRLALLINMTEYSIPMIYVGIAGIMINIVLGLLNLLPIPPLDGSRIVSWLLPVQWDSYYQYIERYGFFILIGLMMTDVLGDILGMPIGYVKAFYFSLAGL